MIPLPFSNNGKLLLTAALLLLPLLASAESTSPQTFVYNGHLLSSDGTAITASTSIRFSYWKSADKVSGDVTATGAINIGATNYVGWQEVHTLTPDSNGFFSVELGSGTALPDFSALPVSTLQNLFLQVEVKQASQANTSYELLDSNPDSDTIDRSAVRSVPFAINADFLDRKQVGTGSGAIPVLGSGGVLKAFQIPSGMSGSVFKLDSDDSESRTITLGFGNTLNKALTYDISNSRFNFNDDLRIQGDLTVTGLINGVDITTVTSSDNKHLKVSSGAGLTISVAEGDYRLKGTEVRYAGNSGIAVADGATNYVFFGSGGLTVRTSAFPTDESFIPLATVVTSGGAVTTITDRRIYSTDDRERTQEQILAPEFDGAAYKGDGSDNVGQLTVSNSGAAITNYYDWTSTRTTLQDYSIEMHLTVPQGFVSWGDPALRVSYRSTSSDAASNKLSIQAYDTSGSLLTLSGSTTNLVSTGWTSTNIEMTGGRWTPGSSYLIEFKLFAKDNAHMQLGRVKVRPVVVPKE